MQTTALPKLHIDRKLNEIRAFCRANADPAIVKKYARYFKEGYDAYGVDPKVMDRQREKWLDEWGAELGLDGFLALGDMLVASGRHEEGFLAIGFAAHYAAEFTPKTLERFACWLDRGLCNWAHVDVFSGEVLARFLTTSPSRDGDVAFTLVPLEAFADWRGAESKWRRRSVPVTLISALKAGYPVPKLLKFISPMMDDRERVVQQGLGWFLREAWKKDAGPVEKLLLEWKDRCGRLIVQYATEKMSAERKKSFRASKKRFEWEEYRIQSAEYSIQNEAVSLASSPQPCPRRGEGEVDSLSLDLSMSHILCWTQGKKFVMLLVCESVIRILPMSWWPEFRPRSMPIPLSRDERCHCRFANGWTGEVLMAS